MAFLTTSVPYRRKTPTLCQGLEEVVLLESVLKVGGAGLEASAVVSRWFDEDGVKLSIVSITVIADAATID